MFEMQPFWLCPNCNQQDCFGVLSVGDRVYRRRCTKCAHSADYWLSDVEKKVIYLDQFVLSEMTKARAMSAHEVKPGFPKDFWLQLHQRIHRLVLLQQAIFPNSDIHTKESTVAVMSEPLREMYESINGDVSFRPTASVERSQILEFASCWITGRAIPDLAFNVDAVLRGERNRWLDKLRISVDGSLMRVLAGGFREQRDHSAKRLASLFRVWGENRVTFEDALQTELTALGSEYSRIIIENLHRALDALVRGDGLAFENATGNHISELNELLLQLFEKGGVQQSDRQAKVLEFLRWDGLHSVSSHQIASHLFAALARKAAGGQRRLPSPGMLNDIRAIASYAPYVDAMFLDKECAYLLREIGGRIQYKAQIFSMTNKDDFLTYLQHLDDVTPQEVRRQANDVYGPL